MDLKEFHNFINDTNKNEFTYKIECRLNEGHKTNIGIFNMFHKNEICLENGKIDNLLNDLEGLTKKNVNIKNVLEQNKNIVVEDMKFNEKYNIY